MDRSSHRRCSVKKGVLKNFANFNLTTTTYDKGTMALNRLTSIRDQQFAYVES